jgi:uncharacterized protein YjbJ (UPF0337 family)
LSAHGEITSRLIQGLHRTTKGKEQTERCKARQEVIASRGAGSERHPVYSTAQIVPDHATSLACIDCKFRQSGSACKEFDMNWDIVEGNWKQFKGKVKARWGNLTDDHLEVIAGKRVALVGMLQEAYGITKGEADRQIKRFEQLNKDYRPKG